MSVRYLYQTQDMHNDEALIFICVFFFTLKLANSIDFDEVAQNDPPHLDLHCLPSSL